jgi:hypothetical protein
VLNCFAVRSRLGSTALRIAAVVPLLVLAAANGAMAHASTLSFSPDCSASGNSLKCYLMQFLDLLYVAAIVLGLALVVVIFLACKSYRESSKKKMREDS